MLGGATALVVGTALYGIQVGLRAEGWMAEAEWQPIIVPAGRRGRRELGKGISTRM